MNNKEKMQLVSDIKFANKMYRQGTPVITDKKYDELLEQLKEVDSENEIFKVGVLESAPISRKEKLPFPMYSLNKEKSLEGIKKWCDSKGLKPEDILIITPKLDGISLLHDMKNDFAWTRGNGIEGQRSDKHLYQIPSLYHESELNTFGEVIITKEKWNDIFLGKTNSKGLPYKSSRNTVAGLFNQDEPTEDLTYCHFIRYGIHDSKEDKVNQLETLQNISYFDTVQFYIIDVKSLTEELLNSLYNIWSELLPIDGVVIDINSAVIRERLGRESNMNPAYAIAYKNPMWSQDEESTVTGYKFQMSKQGKLKGAIQINPVIIDGVEVSQATFYNAKFLLDILPIVGSSIKVKRSGDVIPKITEIHGVKVPTKDEFSNTKEFEVAYSNMKDTIYNLIKLGKYKDLRSFVGDCPSCNKLLDWDENHTELICTNTDCRDIKLGKLEHFFLTCGVEEFGRPSIETLYDNGYTTIESILRISKDDFASIEGFGQLSAETVLKQFRTLREVGIPLARLLTALDLFEGKIGEKTVQLIIDNTDQNIAFVDLKVYDLIKIKGVSEVTANIFLEGIRSFFKRESPIYVNISSVKSPKKEIKGNKYNGLKICFTGVRDKELEKVIIENSGEVVSGVSKTTTMLIVDDLNTTSSKAVKARELNLPIMTIEQFKNL